MTNPDAIQYNQAVMLVRDNEGDTWISLGSTQEVLNKAAADRQLAANTIKYLQGQIYHLGEELKCSDKAERRQTRRLIMFAAAGWLCTAGLLIARLA